MAATVPNPSTSSSSEEGSGTELAKVRLSTAKAEASDELKVIVRRSKGVVL